MSATVMKNKSSADPGSASGIGKGVGSGEESDISEIDRRILALQDYLENARYGDYYYVQTYTCMYVQVCVRTHSSL